MESIIVAIITGGLSLVGVVVTNILSSKRISSEIEHKLEIRQAVTDSKLEELTREVRAHNNFAQRMPVVENEVKWMKEKMEFFHHE
jgi:hypothetical protein